MLRNHLSMPTAKNFIANTIRVGCVFLLSFVTTLEPSYAQTPQVDEFKLKTAFLYNFSQFIEWPSTSFTSSTSPFLVCLVGQNYFGNHLLQLENRFHKTHPIQVFSPKTIQEARTCHMLYIDDVRGSFLGREPQKVLGNAAILTVSSSDDARESGIAISFVIHSGRVRWILNLDAARAAKLKLSSKLIEVALTVTGEAQ
jgi:hypothetical protein